MNGDGSITPVRYLRRAGSADEENRSSVCTRLRPCRHCSPIADDIAEADPLPTTRQTGESTRSAALQFLQWAATRDDSVSANDFHHYLLAPVDSASAANVVQWWRENEGAYPATAAVACRYLSVPTTSVRSERLFLATGHLITRLRSRLLPQTAELLMCSE